MGGVLAHVVSRDSSDVLSGAPFDIGGKLEAQTKIILINGQTNARNTLTDHESNAKSSKKLNTFSGKVRKPKTKT